MLKILGSRGVGEQAKNIYPVKSPAIVPNNNGKDCNYYKD